MGPRIVVILAVAGALLGVGCADSSTQPQGARSYNQRTDVPPRDIGPSGETGAPPRDMPGGGRGSAPGKGK
jgi:hypothetical protein